MTSGSSNGSTFVLLGIGAGLALGAAAALKSNRAAVTPKASTPAAGMPVQSGGGGSVTLPKLPGTTPKPSTPTTPTKPATGSGFGYTVGTGVGSTPTYGSPVTGSSGAATTGSVPAGPSWATQPAVNAPADLQRQADKLAALLAVVNPTAWALSPIARRGFALDLALVAQQEGYPLDLLVGHAWAESALTPCMSPTKGSGAYGPLQVTAITCSDVGTSYPPRTTQEAIRTGIRYLRKTRTYGAASLNDALRMYGLGPGGFRQFTQAGCSGSPCSRPQSVWRDECGCNGAGNRYTWKINAMTRRAAGYNLHTRSWADWMTKG